MKILVVGINTRPVVNSAKKLGYKVYSVSYYNPMDLNADVKEYIINDNYHGFFNKNYSEKKLINYANKYAHDVDYIFIGSGVFESEDSKIVDWEAVVGNPPKKIKSLSNKYHTLRELENIGCPVPITYIAHNYHQLEKYLHEFNTLIVKPLYGHGGSGVHTISLNTINDILFNLLKNLKYPILVQEFIDSNSFSAAYINREFIAFNRQIIMNNTYIGNITPYKINRGVNNIKNTINLFNEIIDYFNLEGMNGIDFMVKDGHPMVIEINPRILGTFETLEMSSNKNLVRYMIENKNNNHHNNYKNLNNYKNYNGKILLKTQYIKKILFAKERLISNIKKRSNIFDIPKYGAIIEKGEPLTTIIGKNIQEIRKITHDISKMVILWR